MNFWMSKITATYYFEVNIIKLTNYHSLIPVLEVKARIIYSNKLQNSFVIRKALVVPLTLARSVISLK